MTNQTHQVQLYVASFPISHKINVKLACMKTRPHFATGMTVIIARVKNAIRRTCSRLKVTYQGAAQVALFAMFLQAMIPLSVAIPLPGDDGIRDGQSLPSFYLVICTAYGAQSQKVVLGDDLNGPLDKVPSDVMPWDCPVCQVQTSVQGPVPVAPQVAFTPFFLPRGCTVPVESDQRTARWNAAPGLARGPPAA